MMQAFRDLVDEGANTWVSDVGRCLQNIHLCLEEFVQYLHFPTPPYRKIRACEGVPDMLNLLEKWAVLTPRRYVFSLFNFF